MKLSTLNDLYIEELKDLYSVENQILKALPDTVKAATAPDLKAGFEAHLHQTQEHVSRLEQIFDKLGKSPKGKHCKGMEGILAEGKELLKEKSEPEALDAGLITAAQHVEHYEIAGYSTVRTYATIPSSAIPPLKRHATRFWTATAAYAPYCRRRRTRLWRR